MIKRSCPVVVKVLCFILLNLVLFSACFISNVSADSVWEWSEQTGSGLKRWWYSIASSSDGTKVVAVNSGGYIYTSGDSGVTWFERTDAGTKNWQSVTSSSDGTKLAAAVSGGYIYTSVDSGEHWTEQAESGSRNWQNIASSADGKKIVGVVDNEGYIYTSSDSGVHWTEQTKSGIRDWEGVAISADGTKIVAGTDCNYLYISTDSGENWLELTDLGEECWTSASFSSDGAKVYAIKAISGDVYASKDSGLTWENIVTLGGDNKWLQTITSSSDGVKLAVTDNWGYIYISTNEGETWAQADVGPKDWWAIASSSNFSKIFATAIGSNSYIYTGVADFDPPSVSLDKLPASTKDKTPQLTGTAEDSAIQF